LSRHESTKEGDMPRHERLDFKGALHYVRVVGRDALEIFFDHSTLTRFPKAPRHSAPHLRKFELLLAAACEERGATLHAYCLEPNSGVFILSTEGAPLDSLMQRLCGGYSRYLRAEGYAGEQQVFAARYESKVIAPEYLPHAVRRVHHSPVVSGLCRRRVDYPFSSERAYTGERSAIPIGMADFRAALELRGHFGVRGYRDFMDQEESSYVANLFTRGSPVDPRIVGSKVFVQQARHTAAHPAAAPTREQLIAGVAHLMRVSSAEIFAATHVGVLGRALVAWYGLRSGAATLSEMGRWFSVTGASLGQAMHHHRKMSPDLFGLRVLPGTAT
jgi:REP element-mobilizing transposase RayT